MNLVRSDLLFGLRRYDEKFYGSTSYLSGINTMILLSWKAQETDDFRLSSS